MISQIYHIFKNSDKGYWKANLLWMTLQVYVWKLDYKFITLKVLVFIENIVKPLSNMFAKD